MPWSRLKVCKKIQRAKFRKTFNQLISSRAKLSFERWAWGWKRRKTWPTKNLQYWPRSSISLYCLLWEWRLVRREQLRRFLWQLLQLQMVFTQTHNSQLHIIIVVVIIIIIVIITNNSIAFITAATPATWFSRRFPIHRTAEAQNSLKQYFFWEKEQDSKMPYF